MDKNTSNTVPGQESNVDPTANTPPNVGNSDPNVGQNPPTLEELQTQLADLQQQIIDKQKKIEGYENEAYREREKERKRKQEQQALEAQRQDELRKSGEFETLAKTLQDQINELTAQIAQRDQEIAKRDYEALRARVAAKHGIAPDLAVRLTGQTEDELNADAEKLKKDIGTQAQQALRQGNAPGPKPSTPTPEQAQQELLRKVRAGGSYGGF